MILFSDPVVLPATTLPATTVGPEPLAQMAMAGDSVNWTIAGTIAEPWLAIDIETTNGRPEEVERHLRLHYTPPSNYKTAEAIGKNFLELKEKKLEKRALLDSAPIAVVTVQTPRGLYALHALGAAPAEAHAGTGGVVQGFATLREMLLALRTGLDTYTAPETLLVGHNIQGFDLPKLRWAYLRAGLRMPGVLAADGQPTFDTMKQYGRRFSQVEKPFVALADLLEEFGLPNHKTDLDGSKVPGMIEQILAGGPGAPALLAQLLDYALRDAAIEARLYLAMTGQLPDAPVTPQTENAGA